MAMVFQSYAIYPHMTVRENMAFPLKLAKRPKEEITRRVEKTAATLDLTELLDRKPVSLSGGQRQRVAMGRAIIREPQAFLLDEPLSNLDAKLRVQMRAELARLQKRLGITAIYVTHDQSEAMTLGDRVAVLRQGEVQQIAPPREIYTAPRNLFVAGFMGSPAMNFFPARLEDRRLILPMVSFELPADVRHGLPLDRGSLIVGIRPEHIQQATLPGNQKGSTPTFKATVDVIEWMGADVYAYLKIQGEISKQLPASAQDLPVTITQDENTPFIARLDPVNHPTEGAELEVQLDISKLHLFDIETGESLSR